MVAEKTVLLVGQKKRSANVVAGRKARRDTGCTVAQPGGKSQEPDPQGVEEVGTKGRQRRRRIGNVKEALSRTLSPETVGGKATCPSEGGSPRSTGVGTCQSKVFRDHVATDGL